MLRPVSCFTGGPETNFEFEVRAQIPILILISDRRVNFDARSHMTHGTTERARGIITSKLGDPYSTRRQIGLDYQSHYAHEDVITEIAVPSPDPPQLWDRHITISFE
jgi:hypothetical protein